MTGYVLIEHQLRRIRCSKMRISRQSFIEFSVHTRRLRIFAFGENLVSSVTTVSDILCKGGISCV
jgi:hypothetical protein